MRKMFSLLGAIVIAFSSIYTNVYAEGEEGDGSETSAEVNENNDALRILFTADLQDHVLPYKISSEQEDDKEVGGYAKLASLINMNRGENTVLLDGGNFSTGTAFHTINTEKAPDLSILGMLNYDAVALGDEEFQYGTQTLSNMVNVSENTPTLLTGNIEYGDSEAANSLKTVLSTKGAATYKILNKGDVKVGVFSVIEDGLLNSDDITLNKAKDCAKSIVSTLKDEGADFVVAMAHGGKDFAHEIAKIDDINVVIASCNVDAIQEVEMEGSTSIVSCGRNGQYLGVIDLDKDATSVSGYQLVEVTSDLDANEEIAEKVDAYKSEVNSLVFDAYGLNMDKSIAASEFDFQAIDHNSTNLLNNNTADLITDAYAYAYDTWYEDWYESWKEKKRQRLKAAQSLAEKSAADNTDAAEEQAEGSEPTPTPSISPEAAARIEEIQNMKPSVKSRAVGMITQKEIQNSIAKGTITAQDAYNLVPNGTGADGSDGESLVLVFLKGSDLRALCEYDVTYCRKNDPDNQLHFSGLKYTYSDIRQDYNHVEDVYVDVVNDYYIPVQNDDYYPVVTTLTTAKQLLELADTTNGNFTVKYYDENGGKIQKLGAHVLTYKNNEMKSFKAISAYISDMERNASGESTISTNYEKANKNKNEDTEFTFTGYFKNTTAKQLHAYVTIAGGIVIAVIGLKILTILFARRKDKQSEENNHE